MMVMMARGPAFFAIRELYDYHEKESLIASISTVVVNVVANNSGWL
jgi:hypothetical protein